MKKSFLLAAVIAAVCVSAGCSLKQQVPDNTTESEESVTQTEAPSTKAPTTEDTQQSTESPSSEAETEKGVKIVIATDTHYLAKDLTDFQKSFQYTVDHGDGKVMPYIWEITDAFIAEMKEEKPDVVILSGDLTYNGEKESHKEFAAKLQEIEDAGIPVIVIPGNHDINNPLAARFTGDSKEKANSITPQEFEEIYQDFGYNEAVSRDSASLSYVYQINDSTRAFMLDSSQYEPKNLVGGMIKDDTYDWIEEQMEEAHDLGMKVIPVSHHNLLDESEVYLDDCTIEHSEQLIDQLESWEVPLYLSGHLHVQHYMKSTKETGIQEIVTSSLSTPPCQYGILYYGEDGGFRYHTKALDMKTWALKTGNKDKNLLDFKVYGNRFLNKVFYNQAQDEFERRDDLKGLSKYQKDQMAKVYAELNVACTAGKVYSIRDKVMKKPGYKMWEEEGYQSILSQYLQWITSDGTKDYNLLDKE